MASSNFRTRRFILQFLLCAFSLFAASASRAQLTYPDPQVTVGFDDRIVHDGAILKLSNLPTDKNWMVAGIDWHTIEGFGLSPTLNGKKTTFTTPKGRVIDYPQDEHISILLGAFASLVNLTVSEKLPAEYRFNKTDSSWSGPKLRDVPEDQQMFSPFESGGTCVFAYNPKAQDAEQFKPVYLIPDAWSALAPQAFKFQKDNVKLFDEKRVVQNQKKLLVLTQGANPFNAIAAAQTLAIARELDAKFIKSVLATAPDYQGAVFTYLAFKNAHPLQQEEVDKALREVILKSSSTAALKWLTLGIKTALNDGDASLKLEKRAATLFKLSISARRCLTLLHLTIIM